MKNSENKAAFIALIISVALVIAACLKKLIHFLKEVKKCKAWKKFFISTPILIVALVFPWLFATEPITRDWIVQYPQVFTLFAVEDLVSFVGYCVYWHIFFTKYKEGLFINNKWLSWNWWWTLDGWQFEEEVAKIFRLYGYKAEVTKKTGDGGVDIILKRDGETTLVQCKHYSEARTPTMDAIRALYGVKDDFNASRVIMVASSGLTQAGYDFANNKPDYIVMDLHDIINLVENLEYEEE